MLMAGVTAALCGPCEAVTRQQQNSCTPHSLLLASSQAFLQNVGNLVEIEIPILVLLHLFHFSPVSHVEVHASPVYITLSLICAPENLYQVSRTFLRRLNWPLCSSEAWQISFLCFVVQDLKPGAPYSPVILSTWAIFSGSPLSVRFTHLRLSVCLKPSANTALLLHM